VRLFPTGLRSEEFFRLVEWKHRQGECFTQSPISPRVPHVVNQGNEAIGGSNLFSDVSATNPMTKARTHLFDTSY
jgi:hypothetical protein